jgi:outer membrane biosynthesis protein TonB
MAKTTTARLEQQTGMQGFFVSAAIHLVLLVILFFITITSPVVEEFKEGLILDFGDSPTGSGDDAERFAGGSSSGAPTMNESPVSPAPSQPSQPVAATTPVKTTQSKTVVTEDPEAIAIKKQKAAEEAAKKAAELKAKQEAAAAAAKAAEEKKIKDQMASVFNKGKTGTGTGTGSGTGTGTGTGTSSGSGPGNGQGPGNGPGNYGSPAGTSGTDWSLKGRTLVSKKVPFNNSQKSGKVLVMIKVDRSGKVYYAKGPQKGSTTTDPYLVKLSEDAAMQFKFNQNSEAAEEQIGTITFNYTFD